MKYTDVKNPRWANAEHTLINCSVNFTHLPEEYVSFTASENDVEEHGKSIYQKLINGEFGIIEEFIPPEPVVIPELTPEQKLASLGLTKEDLKILLGL